MKVSLKSKSTLFAATVNGGVYKDSPYATAWVGLACAYVLTMKAENDGYRKRTGMITKALFKEGFSPKWKSVIL